MIAFAAAVALSACGGSSTSGVLTQSDIPSYLGVKANRSASDAERKREARTPHCTVTGVVVFSVPGKAVKAQSPLVSSAPTVLSADLSCVSVADARSAFNLIKDGGQAVPGIGNEALLINVGSGDGVGYAIGWRQGDRVSLVSVGGPPNDKRITAALAELLARRVAARS